jgi:hypothetical protein
MRGRPRGEVRECATVSLMQLAGRARVPQAAQCTYTCRLGQRNPTMRGAGRCGSGTRAAAVQTGDTTCAHVPAPPPPPSIHPLVDVVALGTGGAVAWRVERYLGQLLLHGRTRWVQTNPEAHPGSRGRRMHAWRIHGASHVPGCAWRRRRAETPSSLRPSCL